MRRTSLSILIALACSRPAEAQILKVPKSSGGGRGIPIFVSASIGYAVSDVVHDGETRSDWDFGSSAQYRGSLELGIGNQSALGLTFSHARMPLRYISRATPAPGGCTGCDAHATIQAVAGAFHAGGGAGFHQVIDLGVGILRYGSFQADQGEAELPPNGDTDFFFSVGYGFGYGLSSTFDIFVVQEYANSLHQRTGLSGNARASTQHYTTRLGVRFGLGGSP